MYLLAGTFIEPSGGGFDFTVSAGVVRFCVEVLQEDGQAVFPVLKNVFEATTSTGLDFKFDAFDGDGGVVAFVVGLDDLGQGFGFQSALEQLAYGIHTGPEDVDVLQVDLLAFRADEQIPFADFSGADVHSFKVFEFHLWPSVDVCGCKSTVVVFYETCYRAAMFTIRTRPILSDGRWPFSIWPLTCHSVSPVSWA